MSKVKAFLEAEHGNTQGGQARYLLVGEIINEKFSGKGFGNVGGGVYQDFWVVQDNLVPCIDRNKGVMEDSQMEELFCTHSREGLLEECNALINEIVSLDAETLVYNIEDPKHQQIRDIQPIEFGNCGFSTEEERIVVDTRDMVAFSEIFPDPITPMDMTESNEDMSNRVALKN